MNHTSTGFVRMELHSIQLGKGIQYSLHGFPFAVLACREGVVIQGKTPMLPVEVMEIFQDVLRRAVRHARHLASTPIGEPQTYLTEEEAASVQGVVVENNDVETVVPFNRPRVIVG